VIRASFSIMQWHRLKVCVRNIQRLADRAVKSLDGDADGSLPIALMIILALGVYSYHLGFKALGPSEAYSALAAVQPTLRAVAHSAMEFDPGKPVVYHLLLHWFCRWFGESETALRSFSLMFGVASIALVFAYGEELFGRRVGFVAATIWALTPLAIVCARWARMYSMFVALALGHLLLMAKLRRRSTATRTIAAGTIGAAMLYTHLAAIFIIGAEFVVVVREFRREGRSVTLLPLIIAVLLFVPFMPWAAVQSHALLFGHWLDWIGVSHSSGAARILVAGSTVALVLWLSLGCGWISEASETLLRCTLIATIPLLAITAGSVVIRPMFSIRYVAPSFAVAAVIVAQLLNHRAARLRNDTVAAIVTLLIILLPLSYMAQDQPWREIARHVAAGGGERETIFFETGFFSPERVIDEQESGGFPHGFFQVPFKYYFKQPNPNESVPGDNPARARELIEAAVEKAGGAWLISGKSRPDAVAELPSGALFKTDFERDFSRVLVLHVRMLSKDVTRMDGHTPDR
jgi:Dolichyl-phosphate-mannose-protein mannosyltransferase